MSTTHRPEAGGDPRVPVTLALLILLGAFLLWRELRRPDPLYSPEEEPREVVERGELLTEEERTIAIFREVSSSVVNIAARDLQRPFSMNPVDVSSGAGSGFVWSDDGYIVTNHHLVARGDSWQVTLADYTSFPARLVGVYRDFDLAVLKIEAPASALKPIPVGSSHDLQVGQRVLAIGNPFGLDRTLTTGVISGLGRRVTTDAGAELHNVIQTDAAINPGNSGGPLLDSSGRLIGINTAIVSERFGGSGIGLAVPVQVVNEVVPFLIRAGRAAPSERRPALGLSVMSEAFSSAHGVDGAVIEEVWPGSGADLAGLRPLTKNDDGTFDMDVIVEVAGHRIRDAFDLGEALRMRAPMEKVEVKVLRGSEVVTLQVMLTELN
ncbi:MAG: trypsin-like peptidase domain-containing protein [Planctomycetes bacterium]|nr:trypsin-like peptidase domain-containing protein [Planctomycetota bacterium]MCB9905450.1 trypsin-like peptidase domain-containing protein [Planctomycetota bacterium]